jgi:FtsZ-binding cell division protein ZapB
MRLRIPSARQAIDTVQRVQNELDTAAGRGNSASERADSFLNWCDHHARPQLGNYFPRTEDLFAELDISYNRIALAPSMTDRRLNGLLNQEYKAWHDRLEALIATLRGLSRFLSHPGRIVVLDTSALMEGPPFATFAWRELEPSLTQPPIRLILPIMVIEELDELMHHRDGDRRKRARDTFKALWELHGQKPTEPAALPGQRDVTIEVMLDDDWHQRRPNNDAEIIDQAVIVRELTGRDVLLATGDGPMLYRAGAAGLVPVRMPRRDES